jgi:hypothetical protein
MLPHRQGNRPLELAPRRLQCRFPASSEGSLVALRVGGGGTNIRAGAPLPPRRL